MGTIVEDVEAASAWMAKALSDSGYPADFSPSSLWQVEFFFEDNCASGQPVRGGLLAKDLGSRLFGLGSYVGEVIRQARGGEWKGDDSDPAAEINVELHLSDGTICWPVQRVMKRFKQGPEDSIFAYGLGLGLDIGPQPERQPRPPQRPWWKFW
ncbi:MAG: hypothetical protein GTO18_08250 [Anaerolineales bacterium]|nr:hypothetical protein [Anaerolineales bacterium]